MTDLEGIFGDNPEPAPLVGAFVFHAILDANTKAIPGPPIGVQTLDTRDAPDYGQS